MKKIFYTFLLISPLLFISSCEKEEEVQEETQSGYDCISNTCIAVFENPQYLTLEDCQSACSENILGCMDEAACNYDSSAEEDNGSCTYAEQGYDCNGNELPAYQIGDLAEGGVVFYVDETGYHGLVAALNQLEREYEWGCYGENVAIFADNTSIGTGYQNTMDIVNKECPTDEILGGITAAQAALDAEIEGYSDWYLPSRDELDSMLNVSIAFGQWNGNYHWSSSEYNSYSAWRLSSWDSGNASSDGKLNAHWVRVIRSF